MVINKEDVLSESTEHDGNKCFIVEECSHHIFCDVSQSNKWGATITLKHDIKNIEHVCQ